MTLDVPNCKYFEFDDKGYPRPVSAKPTNKRTISELLPAALATQYEPKYVPKLRYFVNERGLWEQETQRDPQTGKIIYEMDPSDLRFRNGDGTWMTKAEVGALLLAEAYARGEEKAQNQVLDRILGKPKQEMEVTQTKLTFMDWLKIRRGDLDAQEAPQVTIAPAQLPPQLVNPMNTKPPVVDEIVTVEPTSVDTSDDCSWL